MFRHTHLGIFLSCGSGVVGLIFLFPLNKKKRCNRKEEGYWLSVLPSSAPFLSDRKKKVATQDCFFLFLFTRCSPPLWKNQIATSRLISFSAVVQMPLHNHTYLHLCMQWQWILLIPGVSAWSSYIEVNIWSGRSCSYLEKSKFRVFSYQKSGSFWMGILFYIWWRGMGGVGRRSWLPGIPHLACFVL